MLSRSLICTGCNLKLQGPDLGLFLRGLLHGTHGAWVSYSTMGRVMSVHTAQFGECHRDLWMTKAANSRLGVASCCRVWELCKY